MPTVTGIRSALVQLRKGTAGRAWGLMTLEVGPIFPTGDVYNARDGFARSAAVDGVETAGGAS
jgi:hypothetical protein